MASQIRPVPNKPTSQPRTRGRFQASRTGHAGMKKCKRCNGKSTAAGYICPACNGTGQVARAPQNRFNNRLRKKSLKRCSDSMRVKLELYKDMRPEFLRGKMCEFPQEPFGCSNYASQVHHRRGRGRYLLDRRTWMPICAAHHAWIEANKKQARKMGLITYR